MSNCWSPGGRWSTQNPNIFDVPDETIIAIVRSDPLLKGVTSEEEKNIRGGRTESRFETTNLISWTPLRKVYTAN